MIRAIAALLLLVPAPAQDPPSHAGRRPFDEVVAIIGDRVVLRSTLDREIEARGGTELSREARDQLQREIVIDFVREEIWIQHGKSIGEQAPAAFEETLDRLVDERIKQDIRESGSFSRYEEGLGLLGTSWEDVRRRQRNEILSQLAQGSKMTQLQRSQGLLVTPAEIRRFYDEHIGQFVRPPTFDVAWVGFEVAGDPAEARGRVDQAAAAWRAENLTSADVASRFGGTDLGVKRHIRLDESDTRAAFLKDFASSHELGAVSEPIPRGERYFALLRLVGRHAADSREFEDPEVQALIRRQLALEHTLRWKDEVLARKQRKIYLWPPTLNLAR